MAQRAFCASWVVESTTGLLVWTNADLVTVPSKDYVNSATGAVASSSAQLPTVTNMLSGAVSSPWARPYWTNFVVNYTDVNSQSGTNKQHLLMTLPASSWISWVILKPTASWLGTNASGLFKASVGPTGSTARFIPFTFLSNLTANNFQFTNASFMTDFGGSTNICCNLVNTTNLLTCITNGQLKIWLCIERTILPP